MKILKNTKSKNNYKIFSKNPKIINLKFDSKI